ncbi:MULTISPECIES: hypothetical protein [Novosphingobium]|uniref:Uncharacterized protein n=1 Tax=Novosphingobium decolorationis TaxID=2698673 RepID=A0ABX8E3V2_9SPHN|nr:MULTISPECIES: hypothetical protein [Novosphingobium]MED5545019.1 hypothetical protein [Pseudomonadota bacterium]QVM83669.1 hypothetical protein HT578_08150 [Novosphingobium decolorationis]GAM05397.1 hypothetical conserved protein [Novosphingobium sp. MBES04]
MFKSIFTAAAVAAVALPAAAQASEARNFSHEGVDYAYTSQQKGKITVIEGKAEGRVPFRLYVKGDRVTGMYNNRYVSFTKDEVLHDNVLAD